MKGDPAKLFSGWDSDLNGCGYSDATKDYPYLYWPEPPSADIKDAVMSLDISKALAMLNYGTCVKTCPTSDKNTPVDCKLTTYMVSKSQYDGCQYNIDDTYLSNWGIDITEYTKNLPAGTTQYPYRYNTKQIYGFCVPDLSSAAG